MPRGNVIIIIKVSAMHLISTREAARKKSKRALIGTAMTCKNLTRLNDRLAAAKRLDRERALIYNRHSAVWRPAGATDKKLL